MAGAILWLVLAGIIALAVGSILFMKKERRPEANIFMIAIVGVILFTILSIILIEASYSGSEEPDDDILFPIWLVPIFFIPIITQNKDEKPDKRKLAVIIGILIALLLGGLLVFLAV